MHYLGRESGLILRSGDPRLGDLGRTRLARPGARAGPGVSALVGAQVGDVPEVVFHALLQLIDFVNKHFFKLGGTDV